MSAALLTGPPIHVIGMGTGADTPLAPGAHAALDGAEIVIGAPRYLTGLRNLTARKLDYPSPLSELWPLLATHAGSRIVLLASGDPLFFGIGDLLIRRLGSERLVFHANVSSVQAAFARIGKPWHQARIISLHGRPLDSLKARLRANRLYGLLTDRFSAPGAIAGLLCETGFAESKLWIAEDLGTDRERVRGFEAITLARDTETAFSPLNVVVVETAGSGGILPEFPGIPDEWFVTDAEAPGKGMISKREVRLMILSLLAPRAGETGWDVGAGCGGVSVEWALWNPLGQVHGVECHEGRLACLNANRRRFGTVTNLHVVAGHAPEVLAELPEPDAVFIGGSNGRLPALLRSVWQRLRPGGRLVVAAVTEHSKADLDRFAHDKSCDWTQIAVSRAAELAGQRVLHPYLPVLLSRLEKPR